MKIVDIHESGANNILMWAINNNANIKSDPALQSIINDELSYMITMSDVNFFELFRLTQIYRNRIRIINESKAELPIDTKLQELFKGSTSISDKDDIANVELYEISKHCINLFINNAMQMINDDHIISPNVVRMFLPMISRKFTIQFPITFMDFINSMSNDESSNIYNENYPNTLSNIIDAEIHGIKTALQMAFLKGTTIIKYNKQYDKYINAIKYSPLKTCKNNKAYKIGLLGFFKYNNISKKDVRVDLFNINKATMTDTFKCIANINNPLEFEFVVQLPIQYMQMLENSFSDEVLTIAYESSMSNIIDIGLSYENFITPEFTDDEDDITMINNSIESYRVRLTEANQILLNSIQILLNTKDSDVHITSVFSMLPSIYRTNAVIRFNMNNVDKFISHYDPIIKEMFNDMINIANAIINDINKAR